MSIDNITPLFPTGNMAISKDKSVIAVVTEFIKSIDAEIGILVK